MAAGNNTFIHSMLRQAGFLNVAGHLERYPELPLAAWSDLQPEVVMLSQRTLPLRGKTHGRCSKRLSRFKSYAG